MRRTRKALILCVLLPGGLLLSGCGEPPPPARVISAPSDSISSAQNWALRFREVQDAYKAGLDAYNEDRFVDAEAAFSRGLDLLDATPIPSSGAEIELRRRDLLRTKLAYFSRQCQDRREQAAVLAREIERKQETSPEPIFDYPIEMNPRVAHFIDFYRDRMGERFQLFLTRSGKYIPMMKVTLREHGVPEDLVYLSLIESGYSPKAYSKAHASGLWQFIKGTGKLYDLRMDNWVDERRDPRRSTTAAARHLRDLYDALGDWNLALAAYNCGQRRVTRAIEKQGTRDFWQLDLPKQTEDYVPAYMAATTIAKDPEAYGFRHDYEPPLATETVRIPRSHKLSRLAEASGVPIETLRDLNPALRRDATPPYRDGYEINVPIGTAEVLIARLDGISNDPEPRFEEPATTTASRTYRVQKGDTLSRIAARFGVKVSTLAKANGISTRGVIHRGQKLRIPGNSRDEGEQQVAQAPEPRSTSRSSSSSSAASSSESSRKVYTVRSGDTIAEIAGRHGASTSDLLRWNGISSKARIFPGQKLLLSPQGGAASDPPPAASTSKSRSTRAAAPSTTSYTVRSGDTLWKISQKFGTSIAALKSLNGFRKNPVLHPGDSIKIPSRN